MVSVRGFTLANGTMEVCGNRLEASIIVGT